jgi:hypothetical protein
VIENVEYSLTNLRDQGDRLANATLRGFERLEVTLEAMRGLILRSEQLAPPPPPVPKPRAKGR